MAAEATLRASRSRLAFGLTLALLLLLSYNQQMAESTVPYELREYLTADGRSPFAHWLEGLRDRRARARIDTRLARVRLGNLGDYQSLGDGVYELRVFYGPGYRVYFAFEAQRVVLLLAGGIKDTQPRDIATAKSYWADYRSREDG
jgi:putative addiction module killer protein